MLMLVAWRVAAFTRAADELFAPVTSSYKEATSQLLAGLTLPSISVMACLP
jgi:hypothetical protein